MAIAATNAVTSATNAAAPAAKQPDAKDDAFAAMLCATANDAGDSADDGIAPCTDGKSALQGNSLAALTNTLRGERPTDAADADGEATASGDPPARSGDTRGGKGRKDARDDSVAADPAQIAMRQPLNTQPIVPTPTRDETAAPDGSKDTAFAIRGRLSPDGTTPTPFSAPIQIQPVQPGAAQPVQGAADDDPGTPEENVAETAAAMLADGATAKPASPAEVKPGAQKTEAKATTAAKLADAGKPRTFTAEKLSAPDDAAGPKPAAAGNGDAPAEKPAQQQVPAADAGSAKPAAQPAAQPAPPVAAPVANVQPAQNTAPALPVRLQVHAAPPTTETPDIGSLAVNIAAKAEGGTKHFDIRLDPAELGRVDVRLSVDDAGKAQALLTVEKPQTLELLQKDSTQLERALKDAGLDLTQSGLSFSLKGQQQQAGNGNAGTGARGRSVAMRAIAAVDQAASNISTIYAPGGSDVRLDIRV